MSLGASSLPEIHYSQVADAIRQIRSEIRWRPGKDKAHLAKRIERGHLPPETSLDEYYAIIRLVLTHPEAVVYVFQFGEIFYPTVVALYENQIWLVMFGMDGTMETAFPPDRPDTYFSSPKYHWIGSIQEIVI